MELDAEARTRFSTMRDDMKLMVELADLLIASGQPAAEVQALAADLGVQLQQEATTVRERLLPAPSDVRTK